MAVVYRWYAAIPFDRRGDTGKERPERKMYVIQSDRLRIEIAEPATVAEMTTRFDYTGFVTQVVLDDAVYFAATEPRSARVPSSGGRGLCSAYRFDVMKEAKCGAWVPRLGVGLIQKPDEEGFCNNRRYPCLPFRSEVVDKTPSQIAFCTLPKACMGYAAETTRRLWVEENHLVMTATLRNVGEKEIDFCEYCHNFLTMDGLAVGPDYQLELPQVERLKEHVVAGPFGKTFYEIGLHNIRPKAYSAGFAVFDVPQRDIARSVPFTWRLSHDDAGIAVQGTEDFRPHELCVWCKDHMLCPEVNYRAVVAPGECVTWRRKWTFTD